MAGLQQYYFFPTDFFYPRPQSVRVDTAQKSALPLQIQKRDISDDLKHPTSLSLVLSANNNANKAAAAIIKSRST
ncbi:uncharacterized protein LOC110621673 [Manihot esculenta]|uniref:Uncharacterized protein n=1 Tax=Manihot esculenta TaxID=3983 RepID=A0A2C9VDP0_MANES|nr:uncharacterized protein LOC110621673 [Manihot esculenta]OAY43264.1 hypothetical protein MANES_08G055400v8 [Manihot esculenta]